MARYLIASITLASDWFRSYATSWGWRHHCPYIIHDPSSSWCKPNISPPSSCQDIGLPINYLRGPPYIPVNLDYPYLSNLHIDCSQVLKKLDINMIIPQEIAEAATEVATNLLPQKTGHAPLPTVIPDIPHVYHQTSTEVGHRTLWVVCVLMGASSLAFYMMAMRVPVVRTYHLLRCIREPYNANCHSKNASSISSQL